MNTVAKGASRQECHGEIRVLSHQASQVVKAEGKPNDLIERICNTTYFAPIRDILDEVLDPALYVGRSAVIRAFRRQGTACSCALCRLPWKG